MKRRSLSRAASGLAALVAAAAVAGCGGGDGVEAGPAAAAPEGAPIYIDLTVRPSGSAADEARAAAEKILDTEDPGAELISLLSKEAQRDLKPGETFSWEADIEPWLGERIGLFFTSLEEDAQPTLVVESRDTDAAIAANRKDKGVLGPGGEYEGHPYDEEAEGTVSGAVGDFFVNGPLEGFRQAVDASRGDSLGDSDDFTEAIEELPEDRLGTLYTVPENVLEALPEAEVAPGVRSTLEEIAGDDLEEPVSGSLGASAETIELTIRGGTELETPESSLLGSAPADSWLALGVGDLGDRLDQLRERLEESDVEGLEQAASGIELATGASLEELTEALGDSVIHIRGAAEPRLSGALVVQTEDPDLTGRLLGQLRGLIELSGDSGARPLSLPGGGSGLQIADPELPRPIEIAQQGDRIVIGYGPRSAQQALGPGQSLDSAAAFEAARDRVSDLGVDLFLGFPEVFRLAESTGAASDPDYRAAKPYVDALEYLILGSGGDDDEGEAKAVIGLR